MVVTIEPGIYRPGFAGVRIEDAVLITDDGCELLPSSDRILYELPRSSSALTARWMPHVTGG
jgi:Xaa-Pro aminopeptidase